MCCRWTASRPSFLPGPPRNSFPISNASMFQVPYSKALESFYQPKLRPQSDNILHRPQPSTSPSRPGMSDKSALWPKFDTIVGGQLRELRLTKMCVRLRDYTEPLMSVESIKVGSQGDSSQPAREG